MEYVPLTLPNPFGLDVADADHEQCGIDAVSERSYDMAFASSRGPVKKDGLGRLCLACEELWLLSGHFGGHLESSFGVLKPGDLIPRYLRPRSAQGALQERRELLFKGCETELVEYGVLALFYAAGNVAAFLIVSTGF
jgi:hypothetical protein